MSPLLAARAMAAGRLAIGVAMLAAPRAAVGPWVGAREARRSSVDVVTRAFGARELLLGFLALHVADRPGVGPRTLQALAFCDAVDIAVTAARRDDLPGAALPMIGGVAGSAIITQLWAARALS